MAERFYLSVWLKEHEEANMLDRFRALLDAFPYSESRPRVRAIRVHPFNWHEHPVLEEDFRDGSEAGHALALAAEFLHSDYAYQVAAFWDLWVFQKNGGPGGWKKTAHPVALVCYGPDFEDSPAERGHLEVDFGLDTPFRAAQQLPDADARALASDYRQRLQENIRKLLDFVREVQQRLPVEKRLLWTESGENFADLIRQSLR